MDDELLFSKEWSFPMEYGYEKKAMHEVSAAIERIDPEHPRREDMLTVVAEACLNAFEHGNHSNRKLPVGLQMQVSERQYRYVVFDEGRGFSVLAASDRIDRKWAENEPRGWGIFLIRSLADRFEFGERNGRFCIDVQFDR